MRFICSRSLAHRWRSLNLGPRMCGAWEIELISTVIQRLSMSSNSDWDSF